MTQSSLSRLCRAALVATFLYLAIFGTLALVLLGHIEQAASQADRAYDNHRRLTRLRNVIVLTETAQLGFLVTGKQDQRLSVAEQSREADRLLQELDRTVMRESLRVLVHELRPLLETRLTEIAQSIDFHRSGNLAEARDLVMAEVDRKVTEEISGRINTIQEAELEAVAEHNSSRHRLTLLLKILIGLALLGFPVLGFMVSRRFELGLRPLGSLAKQAELISRGDLDGPPVNGPLHLEIGRLVEAFHAMQLGLKDIFSRAGRAQTGIHAASTRLGGALVEMDEAMRRQHGALRQSTEALEQLTGTADVIARQAAKVDDDTRAQADCLSRFVSSLESQAGSLVRVLQSAEELAQSSRMLSVNASIQAAEAGPEAAALARELHLLSERVNTCSKDGQGSLDDIQRELQSADVFTSSPEVDRLCQATAHHCQTFRQVESALAGVWESATEAGRVSQSAKEDSTLLLRLAQELRQALPERPSGHTP